MLRSSSSSGGGGGGEGGGNGVGGENTNSNNVKNTPPTPLEWLAGGIFAFKGMLDGGGSGNIDSCKDVMSLLRGIDENLKEILLLANKEEEEEKEKEDKEKVEETIATGQTALVAGGKSMNIENENSKGMKENEVEEEEAKEKEKENEEDIECRKLFESRLSRLRFLLYDERRQSAEQQQQQQQQLQQQQQQSYLHKSSCSLATRTVNGLTSGESFGHLIPCWLRNLHLFPFESRKHVAAIFNYLLVCGLGGGNEARFYEPIMGTFRDYVERNFHDIMIPLVRGYGSTVSTTNSASPDVCLHCGTMYRTCCRHASLYQKIVHSTEDAELYIFPFLDAFVHVPDFDISSDAMESLRVVFTGCNNNYNNNNNNSHSSNSATLYNNNNAIPGQHDYEHNQKRMIAEMTAQFLVRDYDAIWIQRFNPKLLCPPSATSKKNNNNSQSTYMTRRVALQILSSVLLTRSNYTFMVKYVASRSNLKLALLLLRDTSPHITLDAFHVFKVFVANPNKPPDVIRILKDNQIKLCRYLQTLHQDREASDPQFRDEKRLIIATIQAL